MKIRPIGEVLSVALGVLLLVGPRAQAEEINVLSAYGMQAVMEDIGPKFERASGHKLTITFDTLGGAVKRVQGGATADLIVIPKQGVDGFVQDGKVVAGNVTVVARGGVGVAVKKGAARPDISSPDALKRTLLAAKSITHANPQFGGTSAVCFVKATEKLGIADEIRLKTVFPKVPGTAGFGLEVVDGEVELAVNLIQELMPIMGVEVVGPLPGNLQCTIVFAAAIMDNAKNIDAAKALVQFLSTPESAVLIKAKGMEPVTQ